MIDLASNVFSLSESEELKNLLKNPEDDFQNIISLLEKKVFENTEKVIESEKKYRSLITVLTNIGFGIDIVSMDHKRVCNKICVYISYISSCQNRIDDSSGFIKMKWIFPNIHADRNINLFYFFRLFFMV